MLHYCFELFKHTWIENYISCISCCFDVVVELSTEITGLDIG
jgi:hypothetical protein